MEDEGVRQSRKHTSYSIPKEEFESNVKVFLDNLKFQEEFLNSFEYVLLTKYQEREIEIVKEASLVNLNVANLKAEQALKLDSFHTTQSEVVKRKLEEQIETLDIKIKQAEELRSEVEINEHSIKSFIRYAKFLMEHPAEMLTKLDDWRARQAILGLIFEDTPTYQEIVNGTPKLSRIFRLSEKFKVGKSQSVTLRVIETRFPG